MQRQRQFDDTEVRPQVPPGSGNFVDQEFANLGSQIAQLPLGKVLQICGPADLFQHQASLRSDRKWVGVRRAVTTTFPSDAARTSVIHGLSFAYEGPNSDARVSRSSGSASMTTSSSARSTVSPRTGTRPVVRTTM